MKRKFLYLVVLTLLSSTVIGAGYAAAVMENDALAVENAKISLVQAVGAAEQYASGKASRAEYEKQKGKWFYEVEVASGQKVFDVRVDGDSGKVLAATEDKVDDTHE